MANKKRYTTRHDDFIGVNYKLSGIEIYEGETAREAVIRRYVTGHVDFSAAPISGDGFGKV